MDIVTALLQNTSELYLCVDPATFCVQHASASVESYCGAELIETDFRSLFAVFPQAVELALQSAENSVKASLRLADGSYTDVQAHPVDLDNKKSILIQLIPHEILQAEGDFSLAERLSLLSNMNHELRSPLNPIVGFSELMLDDPELSKEQKSYANVIRESGLRLLELLEQTIEFARAQTGNAPQRTRPMHIFPVLMKVKTQLGEVCMANKLDIEIHNDVPTKQKFLLDSRLTDKVLGHVASVLASYSSRSKVELHAKSTNTTLEFRIVLHSSSVTQAEVDRWMQPFSGGLIVQDNAADELDRNLMFSLAESEISAHGGSMNIKVVDGMCSLIVELPSEQIDFDVQDNSQLDVAKLVHSHKQSGILIAEDLEFNRMYFAAMLHDENVEFVNDGASALQRVQATPPEVLVMDIRLPHMSGREVLAELRLQGNNTLPIVLISADSDPDHELFASENKAVFLPKPITKAKLHDAIVKAKQKVAVLV